jgi:hypothetical protein
MKPANARCQATLSGTKNRRAAALLVSVAFYVASCSLPAVTLHTGEHVYARDLTQSWTWDGHESLSGAALLFTGWFGLMLGNFAVLANPLLWFSWLFSWIRRDRRATVCASAALVFAMLTFQLLVQPYYLDEAGVRLGYLESVEIGFLCWVASMALVFISSLWAWRGVSRA